MNFGWINCINAIAVVCLIVINAAAVKWGIAGSMKSRHFVINAFEQVGRYGCMIFMILPVAVSGWEFGFRTVAGMLVWLCMTVLLLVVYLALWTQKKHGNRGVLYGLAVVPVCLFLLNGCLLRHGLLVVCALVFGICHLWIVWENVKPEASEE